MVSLREVRRVKDDAEAQLLRLPGVTGVSIGPKYVGGRRTAELAIRVHVARKREVPAADEIPASINGVPTDVIERTYVPLPAIAPPPGRLTALPAPRADPLQGGISIGPCRDESAGTLGMIVVDDLTNDRMMLSNFHVLAIDNSHAVGDTIVQPSLIDDGVCPDDVVGTLERAVLNGTVDAAVARITEREHACTIDRIGGMTGSADAAIDMPVRKVGRSTGLTSGFVQSIDLTTTINYDGIGPVTFTGQIEIAAGAAATSVDPGFFIPLAWSTAATTTVGDVTVERSTEGFAGISVTAPSGHVFHATVSNNVSRYIAFGSGYVLILESTTSAGPVTHRVSIVDVAPSPPDERLVITGIAANAGVQLPVVQHSQGTGSAFMIYSSTGTEIQNLSIRRSGDGEVICPGPPPFQPTGETRGECAGDEVVIHYSSGQMSREERCPLAAPGTDPAFAVRGDSGSVVVDDQRRAIGLVFAASSATTDGAGNVVVPEGAFVTANPIAAVLDALMVHLCAGGGGGHGGGGGGGGGGGRPIPRPVTLSLVDLADRALHRVPPLSIRHDVMPAVRPLPSLRTRLTQLHEQVS